MRAQTCLLWLSDSGESEYLDLILFKLISILYLICRFNSLHTSFPHSLYNVCNFPDIFHLHALAFSEKTFDKYLVVCKSSNRKQNKTKQYKKTRIFQPCCILLHHADWTGKQNLASYTFKIILLLFVFHWTLRKMRYCIIVTADMSKHNCIFQHYQGYVVGELLFLG